MSVCTPFLIQTLGTPYKKGLIRTSIMQIKPVCFWEPLWITVAIHPVCSFQTVIDHAWFWRQ